MGIFRKGGAVSEAVLKARLMSYRDKVVSDLGTGGAGDEMCVRNTDDWVRVWMDKAQCIRDAHAKATATRAITDDGQLIWMVLFDGKRRAYHATGRTATAAFDEAVTATTRRRSIAKRWAEVRALRRDILTFKIRLRPTIEDARQAGLCDLGIEGFLAGTGLGKRADYPGYFLALMSLFDRQVAYPLFAAYQRSKGMAGRNRDASRQGRAA